MAHISLAFWELHTLASNGQPHGSLALLTPSSTVGASTSFSVGTIDVAAWAARNVEHLSLASWIAVLHELRDVEHEMRLFGGEYDLARLCRRTIEAPIVVRRDGDQLRFASNGAPPVSCSAAELRNTIDAVLASLETTLAAASPSGPLWWADHYGVLDPSWRSQDDDTFFANRHSWMFGPNFDAHLVGSDSATTQSALQELARADPEDLRAVDDGNRRWIARVSGLRDSIGFTHTRRRNILCFPPRGVERACKLPRDEAGTLWANGPAPTPQATLFLRGLVSLVQRLATSARLTGARLLQEGGLEPQCAVDAGWIYVYAWSGCGEPTADPQYNRVPLQPR